MAIDWDAAVLGPVMSVFGEGDPADSSSWPLYTPQGSAPFRLADAVFDRAYLVVTELADGTQSTSVLPVLGVRDALFSQLPRQSDTVFIPSVSQTYGVADVQPDGHGHSKLILIEVA